MQDQNWITALTLRPAFLLSPFRPFDRPPRATVLGGIMNKPRLTLNQAGSTQVEGGRGPTDGRDGGLPSGTARGSVGGRLRLSDGGADNRNNRINVGPVGSPLYSVEPEWDL